MDVRLTGQAGVMRVASELMVRGENVLFPQVDTGVDLLTGHGLRVQVKSAHLNNRYGRLGYALTLGWRQRGSKQTPARRRPYSEEVDYIVIWGIDEDRFWIVPAAVLDNIQCLLLWAGRTEPIHKGAKKDNPSRTVYKCEGRWEDLLPTKLEEEAVEGLTATPPSH